VSEAVLIEAFNDHYYKVIEKEAVFYLPSVTTKIGIVDKPNLARWRGDVGNREADLRMYDSGQRGKRIHWAWETALKSGAVVYDPWQNPVYTEEGIAELKKRYTNVAILRTQEEMWAITKLQRQFDIWTPGILGVEEKVYDLDHRDAGTIDSIYWTDGGDFLISGSKPLHLDPGIYINDLKTGSYVDDNVWMQLAPYAYMWEKKHQAQVTGAMVTHTGSTIKTGIPGLKTMVRPRDLLLGKDYDAYRHAAALWERNHEGEQPETFEFPSLVQLNIKEPINAKL